MREQVDRAVVTVLRDCLDLSPGEEVLVICNATTEELGSLFRINAQGEGCEATLAVIAEREFSAEEPPSTVAAAMLAADIVVAPTLQSISHTVARRAATQAGVRIASMPGVTQEMLARVMGADLLQLRKRGSAIARVMGAGAEARITCERGSDLRLGLAERTATVDAGALDMKGAFGNIPCGEAYIAPMEGTAEGTLVVDGSIAGIGKVTGPVELTVSAGHLSGAKTEQGESLMQVLAKHGSAGTNVAELGVGTNEAARLTGNVLEDEKILGTAHVAFGSSAAIGGAVQAPVHVDCVLRRPTVEVDGRTLVEAGELAV